MPRVIRGAPSSVKGAPTARRKRRPLTPEPLPPLWPDDAARPEGLANARAANLKPQKIQESEQPESAEFPPEMVAEFCREELFPGTNKAYPAYVAPDPGFRQIWQRSGAFDVRPHRLRFNQRGCEPPDFVFTCLARDANCH